MFGFFFFLTIFLQEVLGYSALRTGLSDLPFAVVIVVMPGIASQLVSRAGARPLMGAGAVVAAGGMFWFSRLTVHSTYAGGLLGPMLVTSAVAVLDRLPGPGGSRGRQAPRVALATAGQAPREPNGHQPRRGPGART